MDGQALTELVTSMLMYFILWIYSNYEVLSYDLPPEMITNLSVVVI